MREFLAVVRADENDVPDEDAFHDSPIGRFVTQVPLDLNKFERIVEFKIVDQNRGAFGSHYVGYVTTDEKKMYNFEVSDEQLLAIISVITSWRK